MEFHNNLNVTDNIGLRSKQRRVHGGKETRTSAEQFATVHRYVSANDRYHNRSGHRDWRDPNSRRLATTNLGDRVYVRSNHGGSGAKLVLAAGADVAGNDGDPRSSPANVENRQSRLNPREFPGLLAAGPALFRFKSCR
jgi:hypothetical protein